MKNRLHFYPLFLFAVAMGILEAVVVIYAREIYYPEGFVFPLKMPPAWIITVEITREFCTIVMLFTVAWMAREVFIRRLSVFLFLFGVWDIVYYLALKVFLDWPESLLTWDILFFIPVAWTAPVIAPVIIATIMILMAVTFEILYLKQKTRIFSRLNVLLVCFGVLLVNIAFTYDFGMIMTEGDNILYLFNVTDNPGLMKKFVEYVPLRFQWEIFITGTLLILLSYFLMVKNVLKKS